MDPTTCRQTNVRVAEHRKKWKPRAFRERTNYDGRVGTGSNTEEKTLQQGDDI
jgi:hypothetical protein